MKTAGRSKLVFWLSIASPFFVLACEVGGDVPVDAGRSADAAVGDDSDTDTIADADEGAADPVDTDNDGTPDHLDRDSDGDGISDANEAGDAFLDTPPPDSDGDGTEDFRDLDSDGNAIADEDEPDEDTDGDGVFDRADDDDDNDGVSDIRELNGATDLFPDSDGDGVVNHRDPDSDGDLILDGDEYLVDTDADGLHDSDDLDSDDDGISDQEEAGDADLRSGPINSDADTGDTIPDFQDPDSDNDGLSDRLENEQGTNRVRGDSDDDGVSDLIEVAADTDPLDAEENPRTRGDFVFVVPFEEEPQPTQDTLEFRTHVQFADIYFLFDESGSMSTEIAALRTAVTSLVNDLTCIDSGIVCMRDSGCGTGQICSTFSGTCIEDPGRTSCLLSPYTGVGRYEVDYNNILSLQGSAAATAIALNFPTPGGTENLYAAVWGVVDPTGAPRTEMGCSAPGAGLIGCPNFREEAVRILVAFTDENSDDGLNPVDVGAALLESGVTFIGVWTGTVGAAERIDLVHIAEESRSFDRTGEPLVFNGADSAVVPAVTGAINEIVEGVPLRVTIEASDEPDDDGDALQFIDYLEVNTSGGRCSALATTEDTNDDEHPDAFPAVLPGTPVCWDVHARQNDTVEPEVVPLVYRARLTVHGDGSPLDARTVYFLVPPFIPPPDLM